MFNFDNSVFEHTESLTPAVLQACQMLGMYQAELASVLGLQCSDIGRMASVKQFLVPNSIAWDRAILFIRFYQSLFNKFNGDEVSMVHWLKADKIELKNSPLLLMVDHGDLELVMDLVSEE